MNRQQGQPELRFDLTSQHKKSKDRSVARIYKVLGSTRASELARDAAGPAGPRLGQVWARTQQRTERRAQRARAAARVPQTK